MRSTVAGLFDERAAAERAVRDLVEASFSADEISVVAVDGQTPGTEIVYATGDRSGEGIAAGAGAGAVIGGLFGLLVGATTFVIPGAALVAAGPIVGFLTGALAGAATGGIVGGLVGLGLPRTVAEVYAEGVRRGGVVVTVSCDSERCSKAEEILSENGAVDVEERRAYYRDAGWTGFDDTAPLFTAEEIARERENLASRGYSVPPAPPRIRWGQAPTGTEPATPTLEIASMEPFFRSDYLTRFGADAGPYEDFAPAYRWGYLLSSSSVYARTEWNAVAPNIRAEWERANPGTWEAMGGAIRYAWDRARVRTVSGPELI